MRTGVLCRPGRFSLLDMCAFYATFFLSSSNLEYFCWFLPLVAGSWWLYALGGGGGGWYGVAYFHVETSFFSAARVVLPICVSFRDFLIISNSTSLTQRRNFSLKPLVQNYENIAPLYILSVPISRFLQLSKSTIWTRRIWRVFIIWVSMLTSIPSTSNGSCTQALQVMRLRFQFGSSYFGWTFIMKDKKWPDWLWAAVSDSLMLKFFPPS